MADYSSKLNPNTGLIWRIIHRDSLPWILNHGVHCRNSSVQDPNYVKIGNEELIAKRTARTVPIPPNGTLGDYVPFYFTPFSPMMFNIHTGRGGVPQRSNEEICILVSSIPKLQELNQPFVYTDRHAYLPLANFYSDVADLTRIDWAHIQTRNFQRDPNDPEKFERYQAEALVHRYLPVRGLLGIACYSETEKSRIIQQTKILQLSLEVHSTPGLYF